MKGPFDRSPATARALGEQDTSPAWAGSQPARLWTPMVAWSNVGPGSGKKAAPSESPTGSPPQSRSAPISGTANGGGEATIADPPDTPAGTGAPPVLAVAAMGSLERAKRIPTAPR